MPSPTTEPWTDPERALAQGQWRKWIGGAGNHDLAALEDLAGLTTLAGAHCLDVAFHPAAVAAVRRGIDWALAWGAPRPPWLMVSLNDGEDPHFRKAAFDPDRCPPSCPRPCARVCPARAIGPGGGILEDRCYGCGRCPAACPLGLIVETPIELEGEAVVEGLRQLRPDAVEIHTRQGRTDSFARRLEQLARSGVPLRRVAVSCAETPVHASTGVPAFGPYLWSLYALVRARGWQPVWQLDGRPMSGDLGAGTARAAVALFSRWRDRLPPGPIQLAGGTNAATLPLLKREGLAMPPAAGGVAGVAYGSSARTLLGPWLEQAEGRGRRLLDCPDLWPSALEQLGGLWGARGRSLDC
ncbi:MAG: LdpA C-terminal domain-containing domain [Synechococcus sp.]